MLDAYLDAFAEPDRGMTRLYSLAQRVQWREDDLPWDELRLDGLPEPVRRGAADLFTQVLYGELAAMLCAARLVQELPQLPAKLVCATQVADEARHVRWFARLLARLDRPGRVRPVVVDVMQRVYAAESPEALVLGMNVVVEGLAHSMFTEGGVLLAELSGALPRYGAVEALRRAVEQWLAETVAADERRHVAFGTAWLRQRMPDLDPDRRTVLMEGLEQTLAPIEANAREPDLFTDHGLDWSRFGARCARELDARLTQCRLDVRCPPLEHP